MKNLKKVILIASVISSIYILFVGVNQDVSTFSVIPLIYGIAYYTIIPQRTIIGAGFTMMTLVLGLRYIIYPMLISSSYISDVLRSNILPICLITIFEIFVILATIRFYYIRKKVPFRQKALHIERVQSTIPNISIIVMIILIIFFPQAFSNIHFIFNTSAIAEQKVEVSGIVSQLRSWSQIYLIIYFFSIAYRKFFRTKNSLFYYLSIIVFLFPALFFSGNSRLSLLMPLISCSFMLYKVYGKKAKNAIIYIFAYGIVGLTLLSLVKFYGVVSSDSFEEMALNENAELINAYFGGFKNIAIGYKAYLDYGSSVLRFFNDILRNAIGISQYFVDDPNNSVYVFNHVIYGSAVSDTQDQICPTIIEGLLMFGPLLCWIPSAIMALTICIMDYKWAKSSSLEYSYLYAYIGTLIGWCVPGNLMHLSSTIFNILIPMSILFYINKKLKLE